MPRPYKPLPPLWLIQQKVRLTDAFPSGLEWTETTARHKEGEMAGYLDYFKRYYVVSIYGEKYHSHRIVYYLRTEEDPGNADVVRLDGLPYSAFPTELKLEQRKTPKQKTRRNRRQFIKN